MTINRFCENALEQAVLLKEMGKVTDVIVMSVGGDDVRDIFATCYAKGATQCIHVQSDVDVDGLDVARAIVEIAKRESVDIVFTGKQASDTDNNHVAQMVSAFMDCPQALYVSQCDIVDGAVAVQVEADTGVLRQSVLTPCVLSADLNLVEPRYASVPKVMQAKRKAVESISLDSLGIVPQCRQEITALEYPTHNRKNIHVDSAAQLVDMLKKDGVL
jgi:electron transfer flavoprotein beta subunit